jgi:prevent-host-death family protein
MYGTRMSEISKTAAKGAEEARNALPALLDLAERGDATVISRHGRPVAAIVPIALYEEIRRAQRPKQRSLLSLSGSGVGLREDSTRRIREMRDEWTR